MQKQIKQIEFFGNQLQYFFAEDGNLFIEADAFFDGILLDNKYLQLKKLEQHFTAEIVEDEKFYNVADVMFVLQQYDVQKRTLIKRPENYVNYIKFMTSGCLRPYFQHEPDAIEQCPDFIKDVSALIEVMPEIKPAVNCEELQRELEALKCYVEVANKELERKAEIEQQLEIFIQENEALRRDCEKANVMAADYETLARAHDVHLQDKYSLQDQLSKIKQQLAAQKKDVLSKWLTDSKVMLYATILVIAIFLPFTVLNLKQYIAIETSNIVQDALLYILCIFIASAWDFSILLFAVNGKKQLALMGSCFQFIFIGAKFDFFSRYVSLMGFDGAFAQSMIVMSAIAIYSPVLVSQFTELATKSKSKNIENL